MKRFPFIFLAFTTLVLSGCAGLENSQEPQLTPLEIQNLETREYSASKERVFACVMSVFQNLGYTIISADQITGFISARSLLKSSGQLTATAVIEATGHNTRVRLSFVQLHCGTSSYSFSHRRSGHGKYGKERQVLDAAFYQNAFEQIDSELFVRSVE